MFPGQDSSGDSPDASPWRQYAPKHPHGKTRQNRKKEDIVLAYNAAMREFFLRKKPETLAISIAIVGTIFVLGLFTGDLLLTRHRDLTTGEQRLRHFSLMMAEHTARGFEAADSLLRDIALDLSRSRRDWSKWEASQGWDYVARRHSAAMPQIRDIAIFDSGGNQRFLSTQFPPPPISVSDRPYFVALRDGATAATYGPFLARHSGRYTFVLARRLEAPGGSFSGLVVATIEPAYLEEFCWPARLSDMFEAVLTNAEGKIIASCRPADQSPQSTLLGKSVLEVLFPDKPVRPLPEAGVEKIHDIWISTAKVPGFPELRIYSSLPEKALLENWRMHLIELLVLGLLVSTTLIFGALLIRRQIGKMSAMTEELAASRNQLEARVQAATEALAGQRDNAERENTAKSRFLAAASHDLRQPMHALALFAADLQRQVRNQNQQELPRLAEQIAASANALGERLDTLLDISRIDVSGIVPDRHAVALAPLFARLEQAFRRSAEERGIQLKFHAGRYWVDTDPGLLERILSNLIANALRYTPPGGRVLLGARRRGTDIELEVRDSGIGIAQEHQDGIFREFYQVGNRARVEEQGLGLGLSIVDRLARALDIAVGLRSRLGEGSTFTLRLPAASASAASPSTSSHLALGSAGKIHGIGNSDELLECLRQAAGWGYEVTRSEDEAPSRATSDSVLICDAKALAQVQGQASADRPLIVLTADPGLELPADSHALQMPVRPAKLRALVSQLQKTRSKSIP